MNRLAVALVSTLAMAGLTQAQTTPPATPDRSASYYHYSLGHLYEELAQVYGNRGGDYLDKAIDNYKLAMKEDPTAGYIFEELTDLYVQFGRLKDAVAGAEEMLRRNPDNLDARRLLGRIYTRMIGDPQQGKVNDTMLKNAIEQYQKITEKDPKDVESWLTLGRLYRASNNSVEAEKAFNKVLAQDPNNEDALTNLAMVYSDLGNTQQAIEKLKAATDQNSDPRMLAALAGAYEQLRDWKDAAAAMKRAVEAEPDNPRLKTKLAQYLLYSDQLDEALKYYTQLAADDPKDGEVQLRLSEIYREKKDFTKAHAALDKAKALDSDSMEVRYDEVNLLESEGKTDQAIAGLKGLVDGTAKPSYSAAERTNRSMLLERLGVLYRNANQTANAVDAFRQIAAMDPDNAMRAGVQIVDTYRLAKQFQPASQEAAALLKKYPDERLVKMVNASLLSDMGKTDEAAAQTRSLLDGKNDRDTYLALAQIYEKGKRWPEMAKALDEAEKLTKSDSDRENIFFMRGAMYERMKQFDQAETEFRKVLKLNPDSAGALNYLGYMFADRNVRLDEAAQMVKRAVDLDPQNGAYLDSLGWVYYRQNRLNEAENLLVNALAKIGKDPTVHDHLGDVYFKLGKTKDAITQWQASLAEYHASPDPDIDPGEIATISKKLESAKVRLAQETGVKQQ